MFSLQLLADAAALSVGVVSENDHGQRVHHLAVEQKVQTNQLTLVPVLPLVVVAGVAAAAGLDGVKEVVDDLAQRYLVMQVHARFIHILHVNEHAALGLAEVHQRADVIVGGVDVGIDERLLGLDDAGRVGVGRGVIDDLYQCRRSGSGGTGRPGVVVMMKIEVKLTLQPLGDDLHVQQAQEAAAEAKAQGSTGFRLKTQRCIVELAVFPVRLSGLGSRRRLPGRCRRTPSG